MVDGQGKPLAFHVLTRESQAASAADRWARQYGHIMDQKLASGRTPRELHAQLVALGPKPSVADVDAVIGNDSWTDTRCDHCGSKGVPTVRVGEAPDYESSTAMVCGRCLVLALDALDGVG